MKTVMMHEHGPMFEMSWDERAIFISALQTFVVAFPQDETAKRMLRTAEEIDAAMRAMRGRTVDAYAVYETEVEAETASEATDKAKNNEEAYNWGEPTLATFDARSYIALDDDDEEIEDSLRSDL